MNKIIIYHGDITKVECQAIVNAANTSLMGGGGVDGAIHRAGGTKILDACKKIRASQGGCKVGHAVITTAGNLLADKIIHTVGPVWNNKGVEEELLRSCYKSVFDLAVQNNICELAIPNISTGIYRFPKKLAAEIAIEATKDFLKRNENFKQVIFVCFDIENYLIYKELLGMTE
ncbi:O-acetyl-ADP-ribose deacetylase [Vallitalea sp. AN17-2]|uniref:O-acetyl-ADP-ribose deacetylase n=1 Tax=Vallitalea maricola TaxID=3074433 RepID=A0ACB5UG65_9FIRM|nr:O-acetyl-ADP-ribose deacetylase [Vallitalea sp. AN17-2]